MIEENIGKALGQLRQRLASDPRPDSSAGLVAVSISKAVNPESKWLVVDQEADIERSLTREAERIHEQYARDYRRKGDSRLIGVAVPHPRRRCASGGMEDCRCWRITDRLLARPEWRAKRLSGIGRRTKEAVSAVAPLLRTCVDVMRAFRQGPHGEVGDLDLAFTAPSSSLNAIDSSADRGRAFRRGDIPGQAGRQTRVSYLL